MKVQNSLNRASQLAVVGLLAAAFAILFAAGCEPIDATYVSLGDGNGNGNDGPYTTPEALLVAHEAAWEERDYEAYEALLDVEFEFYPLSEDAIDFPWMTSDSWGRTEELGIVNNMFDPNFTGGNGSVDLIDFDAVPQSTRVLTSGRTEIICSVLGRVMWTATDGASFDTRMNFELGERNGSFLIFKVVEIPRTVARDELPPVDASSFGSIKGMYK